MLSNQLLTKIMKTDIVHENDCNVEGEIVDKKTIYDIATIANVSPSTVSRVVNKYPYVKKATRDKVLKVLKENNYVPDETARGLVTQSSKMIGILISDIRTTHHTDAIFALERELAKKGYCCIILNTGSAAADQVSAIKQLSQRKVDAAILIGSVYQTEAVGDSITRYLPTTPIMMLNGYLEATNVYGLIADEKQGVYDVVRLLAKKRRKNLAFIVDKYTPSNLSKIEGFKEGMQKYCGGSEPIIVKSEEETGGTYGATIRLFDENPEINGIIYAEDMIAFAGIRALMDAKLLVPEAVAVVGINNSQYAVNSIPTLTSLDNMIYDMSKTLIKNMIFVMMDREVPHLITMKTKIVERESTNI